MNYGQIKVGTGKSLYLIAEQIENHGELTAPGGDVGLYARAKVSAERAPDGRGLSADVKLPSGSVDNFGQITADAGTIALQAQVVNQDGIIQANSVQNKNGVIELVASDSLSLGANSTISANGDATATDPSPGGIVVLDSGNSFTDSSGSQISVAGRTGGRDGMVEIFGTGVTANNIQSGIDGLTAANYAAQDTLLINPYDITLSQNPTASAVKNNNFDVNFNVNDLASFSQLALFAADNIELQTAWRLGNLNAPTTLHLQAGNNIKLDAGSSLLVGNNWNVDLVAGAAFVPQPRNPRRQQAATGFFWMTLHLFRRKTEISIYLLPAACRWAIQIPVRAPLPPQLHQHGGWRKYLCDRLIWRHQYRAKLRRLHHRPEWIEFQQY